MANGHWDVNVPPPLHDEMGTLLHHFHLWLLEHSEISIKDIVRKKEGGHVTDWWLYTAGSRCCPRKSQMVFGETTCKKVNAVPHLWVRCNARWSQTGVNSLQAFLRSRLEVKQETLSAQLTPSRKGAH